MGLIGPVQMFNSHNKRGHEFQFPVLCYSGNTLDPTITKYNGRVRWNYGDGSAIIAGNELTHSWSGETTVRTITMSMDRQASLRMLDARNDNIISMNLNGFNRISGATSDSGPVLLSSNSTLTAVTVPNTTMFCNIIWLENCNLIGNVDISQFGNPWQIYVTNNPLTTGITVSSMSNDVRDFGLENNDLTGLVDLSPWSGLGGGIDIRGNPNLTGVTFHSASTYSSIYDLTLSIYDCDLYGTLDLTGINSVMKGSDIRLYNNSNLTGISFPSLSGTCTRIWAYNTGLRELDLSPLSGTMGQLYAYENSNMTALTMSNELNITSQLYTYNSDITGVLDLTPLNGAPSTMSVYGESNMTGLLLPSHSGSMAIHSYNSCNLSEIDLSPLSGTIETINLYENSNMTALTMSSDLHMASALNAYSCDLTGTVDLSMMKGPTPPLVIAVDRSSSLTSLLLPALSGSVSNLFSYSCDLQEFDVSPLSGSINSLWVYGNSNLTAITMSNDLSISFEILAHTCDLTGIVDLSTLKGEFPTYLHMYSNSNLTGVLFPSLSVIVPHQQIYAYSCDLQEFDLSPLSGSIRNLSVYSNPNMTALTVSSGLSILGSIYTHTCDITGTLDLSPLAALSGIVEAQSMVNMTGILFPTVTNVLTSIRVDSSSVGFVDLSPLSGGSSHGISLRLDSTTMNAGNVNHTLYDLDNFGWTAGTLQIESNAAPDGSSGGFDGLTALGNLTGASGWSITTD